MKYQRWHYRNGSVIVEKYLGEMTIEQVISNDDDILSNVEPSKGTILALSDISEASFRSIDIAEVGEMFQGIDAHISNTFGMKLALYTGQNQHADFQKAVEYARQEELRPFSIAVFIFLDAALHWLQLSDEEIKEIKNDLKSYQ